MTKPEIAQFQKLDKAGDKMALLKFCVSSWKGVTNAAELKNQTVDFAPYVFFEAVNKVNNLELFKTMRESQTLGGYLRREENNYVRFQVPV